MNVQRWLKDLVRDDNLSSKDDVRAKITGAYGGEEDSDYYLRTPSSKIEVDHVFECQLLAKSLFSAEEVKRFITRNGTTTATTIGGQPVVVQNFLRPIYDAQNGQKGKHIVDEPFNLRLLDKQLNIYKGKAYSAFLKSMDSGVKPAMQDSLLECSVLARADREEVCGRILSDLSSVQGMYDAHLDSIGDAYGASTVGQHASKYDEIRAEINNLYAAMDL